MMIYGRRIRLRGVEQEDLIQFVTWLNDPEVIANLEMYRPLSMAEEQHWFEGMLKRPPDERPLVIEISEGDGWRMIGNLSLLNIDWRNRSAEVGIFIGDKSCWNQGYGTEAMKLMLRHAFEMLNLNRVYLRVYETNPRAIRAYQKAGYVVEGRDRQGEYRNGKYWDVIRMSVLRKEWKSAEDQG
jgi:RimJ/RimL family protein N-acetyltransferase